MINPYISVDCVIFGFDETHLKVLLIERERKDTAGKEEIDFKLPGDFIDAGEDLDFAANRTLKQLTGLANIFLKPVGVFGKPDRVKRRKDSEWLIETTGMEIKRVVTSAYYSLIRIDKSKKEYAINHNAHWYNIGETPPLAFDHDDILKSALDTLRRDLRFEPIGFELLPGRFTIRQIQSLYEAIMGKEMDNRNFRKKILKAKYLVPLEEKQKGVAHKPARFYRFDRERYEQSRTEFIGFNF
jgi:8-oxo-dGTP diphosphatase